VDAKTLIAREQAVTGAVAEAVPAVADQRHADSRETNAPRVVSTARGRDSYFMIGVSRAVYWRR
jgi:hypothetical protein